MSKEFEEIVLKKLEKLDDIEKEVKNNSQRLGNLETEVGSLGTEVATLKLETERLGTEVGSLKTTVGKLEMEVKDTGEVVNYLNQRFTKFDFEINKKIDTLFDAYKVNKENNSAHEKEIVSLNAKVFNHDLRISNLEEKVLTA